MIAIVLIGVGCFVMYYSFYPELRAWLVFQPTAGRVTHSKVYVGPGRGCVSSPDIQFSYRVAGQEYREGRYRAISLSDHSTAEAQAVVQQHPVGSIHPAWFDPNDHSVAVLVRDFSFVGAVGVALSVLGIVAPVWLWRLSRGSTGQTSIRLEQQRSGRV